MRSGGIPLKVTLSFIWIEFTVAITVQVCQSLSIRVKVNPVLLLNSISQLAGIIVIQGLLKPVNFAIIVQEVSFGDMYPVSSHFLKYNTEALGFLSSIQSIIPLANAVLLVVRFLYIKG